MFGTGRFVKCLSVLLALLLLTGISSQTANAQFVHPGGLHTQADLDRMKAKVAAGEHPWIDNWNQLIADPLAQNTYTAAPRGNLGSARQRADQDAHAAYLNALRWYISGDTSHADAAVRILNAWAYTANQVPTMPAPDVYGLQAIAIQDFALAAEVLRIYPGWAAADQTALKNMFTNYMYPAVHEFLTNHNGACISYYWANWDAANIGALIAMGVFNDNLDWFEEGVEYYMTGAGAGSIRNAVVYRYGRNGELGQWQETGRDQEHAQLGVGLLGYAAQVAWNQGIDLFAFDNNRLLAGAEYVARYNMAKDVPYRTYDNCDNVRNFFPGINGRGRLDDRPVWELIYNHYGVRKGLNTPNSKAMAELMRPEHGSIDHFGYGTLTFTLDADQSPFPSAPAPAAPTGLVAMAGVGRVYLDWNPVATANEYRILRATSSGGPYTAVGSLTQSTWNRYTDYTVSNGTTYYYTVQAANQSGVSSQSAQSNAATPMAAGSVLPAGWANADVGTVDVTGSASYAPVANNTFIVTGQGRGIGGSNDSFHYAYKQVTGDFTLIARITDIRGTLSYTGLMMRESLDDHAPAATMLHGGLGWRFATFGARASPGADMAWTTGNKFTWRPAWFKLERLGNVFTAYQSVDGSKWFRVSSSEIPMASTYYVGLAACSGDSTQFRTETTTFDFVGKAWPRQSGLPAGAAGTLGTDKVRMRPGTSELSGWNK